MEVTFNNLRSKEVINLYDGKRLGKIIDVVFSKDDGRVVGFVLPAIKKVFKKNDDIFIPLELIRKIGDDVILVKLMPVGETVNIQEKNNQSKVYVRYKRVDKK